jgi:hypothetical protein
VQDAEKADLGAQVLGVARDAEKGFRGGPEENAVNHFFVVEGDADKFFGNGENDMKVFNRQQFGLPAFKPFCPLRVLALRAMADPEGTPAGVIRVAGVIALAAFFDMAAGHGGTADFDGAHDAQLLERQPACFAVSFAVLSKNAGQFESGPAHVISSPARAA